MPSSIGLADVEESSTEVASRSQHKGRFFVSHQRKSGFPGSAQGTGKSASKTRSQSPEQMALSLERAMAERSAASPGKELRDRRPSAIRARPVESTRVPQSSTELLRRISPGLRHQVPAAIAKRRANEPCPDAGTLLLMFYTKVHIPLINHPVVRAC